MGKRLIRIMGMKFHEFSDYHGPTGPYVATGTTILPIGTVAGTALAAQSAMLASLGPNPEAQQYAQEMEKSIKYAHTLDGKKSF